MQLLISLFFLLAPLGLLAQSVPLHHKVELEFTSNTVYANPLYDLNSFTATFTSPTGREWTVDGFWDGGADYKVRFRPDEPGEWSWRSRCSDAGNTGLHGRSGSFVVDGADGRRSPLYTRGPVQARPGAYHLTYADGTPFFWTACTAWNGATKSTDEEWETYLTQRAQNNYNVIQYVTTQWRGNERNAEGLQAYSGGGRIAVNPEFFRRIDAKTDAINAHGQVAAPVLLWALQVAEGRELSPGYALPLEEAVLLARYIVARLQGNQVVWILGGDGLYTHEYEQRWKEIGRRVFGRQPTQSPVCLHPRGISWTGDAYADEEWIDFVGYQSSHSNQQGPVDWITQGPPATRWDKLPPRPLINMEPNYEEINFSLTAEDVRNACYWSVFATPPAGITYGANGIWPWIQQEGELIENHDNPGGRGPSTWRESIDFPGSKQIGLLHAFMTDFEWWELRPAQDLLLVQPGHIDSTYNHFISVVANADRSVILAYVPRNDAARLRLPAPGKYRYRWFDPRQGTYSEQQPATTSTFSPPGAGDWILVLEK